MNLLSLEKSTNAHNFVVSGGLISADARLENLVSTRIIVGWRKGVDQKILSNSDSVILVQPYYYKYEKK